MDLGDVLLILVFLVFPLLQQLLGRLGSPRPPAPPPGTEEEGEGVAAPMEWERHPDLPGPAPEPRPERPREWEAWTAEAAAEEIASREVVDEEEAAELTVLQARLPAETVPEAVRVSSPVVSMEALRVERPAKPARIPARAEAAPVPERSRRPSRTRELLRGPGDLRRAVLLSEVLGPPKGLR